MSSSLGFKFLEGNAVSIISTKCLVKSLLIWNSFIALQQFKWPASQTNLAVIPRLYKKDSGSLVGEGNVDLIAYLIQSFILLTPLKT